jgi:hypothetical protein
MDKFVNVIFIMDEWEIDAGKHLIYELSIKTKQSSQWLVVQKPLFFIPDLLLNFRTRFRKFLKGYYKSKKVNENITLFTPVIPFHISYWLTRKILSFLDNFLIKHQLKSFIKKNYQNRKIVLWVYTPKLYPLSQIFKQDYVIYYIQDNVSYDACKEIVIYPDYNVNIDLIIKSDLVFSTSKTMFNYAIQYNKNVFHIPNGNNFEILTKEINVNYKTEIDNVSKPVIGYLGGIRCWLDFELIEYLLENLDDCYFVFIGPLYKNAARNIKVLMKYKNFIWIKFKEQNLLYHYLKKFKAGIIPFRNNVFMDSVFPNKFYEYMAYGIPVITTALNELSGFSNIIGYSNSKEEFLKNCQDAVNGRFSQFKNQYIELAKQNTWNNRADIFYRILKEKLNINK